MFQTSTQYEYTTVTDQGPDGMYELAPKRLISSPAEYGGMLVVSQVEGSQVLELSHGAKLFTNAQMLVCGMLATQDLVLETKAIMPGAPGRLLVVPQASVRDLRLTFGTRRGMSTFPTIEKDIQELANQEASRPGRPFGADACISFFRENERTGRIHYAIGAKPGLGGNLQVELRTPAEAMARAIRLYPTFGAIAA